MTARPLPHLAKNYKLVYDVICEGGMGTHLPMTEVFTRAKARQPQLGFTTVYRALARLRDLGLVAEIALPGADMAYYELAGEPHAHFRCERCGHVEDVDYVVPRRVVNDLARRHGAEVEAVTLSLHGRCAACR